MNFSLKSLRDVDIILNKFYACLLERNVNVSDKNHVITLHTSMSCLVKNPYFYFWDLCAQGSFRVILCFLTTIRHSFIDFAGFVTFLWPMLCFGLRQLCFISEPGFVSCFPFKQKLLIITIKGEEINDIYLIECFN